MMELGVDVTASVVGVNVMAATWEWRPSHVSLAW
jgi:hypothetical protein